MATARDEADQSAASHAALEARLRDADAALKVRVPLLFPPRTGQTSTALSFRLNFPPVFLGCQPLLYRHAPERSVVTSCRGRVQAAAEQLSAVRAELAAKSTTMDRLVADIEVRCLWLSSCIDKWQLRQRQHVSIKCI